MPGRTVTKGNVPSVSKVPAIVAQPSGGSLRPKLGANARSPKIIPVALDEQRHQLEERIRAEKVRALELNVQESKQRLWKCLVGQKNFRVVVFAFPLLLLDFESLYLCCQVIPTLYSG